MVVGRRAAGIGCASDSIYGATRGRIITFATIAGTDGAGLPERVALMVGLASLVANGFAMSAGNYSRTKPARQNYEHVFAVDDEKTRLVVASRSSPLKAALSMFTMMMLCGLVPLISY